VIIDHVMVADSEAKPQCIVYASGSGYEKIQVTYLDIMRKVLTTKEMVPSLTL